MTIESFSLKFLRFSSVKIGQQKTRKWFFIFFYVYLCLDHSLTFKCRSYILTKRLLEVFYWYKRHNYLFTSLLGTQIEPRSVRKNRTVLVHLTDVFRKVVSKELVVQMPSLGFLNVFYLFVIHYNYSPGLTCSI